jgi:hypothetical protein
MKRCLAQLTDPLLHVAAVGVLIVGAALSLSEASSWRPSSRVGIHPSNCHACSILRSRTVQDRDAALIKAGAIDEAEILD